MITSNAESACSLQPETREDEAARRFMCDEEREENEGGGLQGVWTKRTKRPATVDYLHAFVCTRSGDGALLLLLEEEVVVVVVVGGGREAAVLVDRFLRAVTNSETSSACTERGPAVGFRGWGLGAGGWG